jgi:hypothetical protein
MLVREAASQHDINTSSGKKHKKIRKPAPVRMTKGIFVISVML